MKFSYQAEEDGIQVKTLLKREGISRRLLTKIKYSGGQILVNDHEEWATYFLNKGDKVTVEIPAESPSKTLIPQEFPLDIIYEDDHYLLINKPAGYASVTGANHPDKTMSNFVQAYLINQGYENQKVHLATRLDRDTSGLMLFAKHGFAHSFMDRALQDKSISKEYYALVENASKLAPEGDIFLPIDREENSIIKRCVSHQGKFAHTFYQKVKNIRQITLLKVKLHTGRTHQIRVHFSYLGSPLLGDDLYGGKLDYISRQALHCYSLEFYHPFLKKEMKFKVDLPQDMKEIINGRHRRL